jgi:nucleotide-binding universal stress UspA family protein
MKILLGHDGREHSESAVRSAAELARGGGHVTILIVFPEGRFQRDHDSIARARELLEEQGVDVSLRKEHGRAASEIVRVAEEGGYELIVVGSRGRGPVGELLLGSVSRAVARIASCSVLVVSPDAEQRLEPAPR